MSEAKRVVLGVDLVEFFRQEIVKARDDLGVKMNDATEFYLVNLLCDFSRRDERSRAGELGNEPLALLYKRALEAEISERLHLLKGLGDTSLYLAGFFTDRIDHTAVDVGYYITMGGHAYTDLATLMGQKRQGGTFAQLYNHLAGKFTDWVDVLNEISDRSRHQGSSDADLVKIYDRWRRTGSKRLRRQLHARGLITAEGLPTEYAQ